MDRVESYVFDISGDSLYQSSSSESLSSPSSSSATSSSIGKNSDDEEDFHGGEGEENEAESTYKGPLDLMESLEEVLPVGKGISSFYNGKSKSFTNLAAEAAKALTSSSSMKDLAKPENPYSRRRRNLLCHQIWENNNKKTTPRGGISKKHVMSSSRSALTLAMAVAAGEGSSSGGDSSQGSSPSPPRQRHHMMMLPPLYPRSQGSIGNLKSSQSSLEFCALRSYSVADISRCFPASGLGSSDS